MASKTQIANMALSRIGVSKLIANVATETSREAIQSRLLMDEDIRYVLRDFPWPWATQYATLALVAGTSSENAVSDWRYAYRYPTDCLFARRIVIPTVGRRDANPPPFRIGRDSQGKLIYTDEEDAELEFTADITSTEEFDALFVSMLAWKHGAALAPSLSRIKGMAESAMQMYELDKAKAQSRALNEGQQSEPIEAEAISARD
jgi:hypothetical protein